MHTVLYWIVTSMSFKLCNPFVRSAYFLEVTSLAPRTFRALAVIVESSSGSGRKSLRRLDALPL